ncbi:MAG TPA: methyltransferase, partial [Gemmata sp.]|nr:methyltransferase [Gemmata sp.]
DAGLSDRCRTEGGDFFKTVPAGADAYMMMHIIHDWPDDRAATILKNCRKSVNPGGKLLVVDSVVAGPNEPDMAKVLDLEMLLIPGGKERTEAEFAALFAAAGWKLNRVVRTKSPKCVIEGAPV